MRFGNFSAIHFLWIVIGAAIFFIWAYKYRLNLLKKFAQKELLGELVLSFSFKKYILKIILLSAGLVFLVISLTRPQWGFKWQEVKRKGVDILIALDVSKSMLAPDIKPSRLERAKLAIKDLVNKLEGDRVGLIAFSGTAFVQCPLTLDYSGFLLSMDEVDTGIIPRGGTSLTSAIKEAVNDYEGGQREYKVLVIITDGEDHEGDAVSAAQEADKKGIKIFCIGLGTEEGELIPNRDGEAAGFLKDREGNVVKTRLNEKLLREVVLKTGGSYVRATPLQFGLDLLYEQKISKMEKKELKSKMVKKYEERFQIPLGLALIFLAIEALITTYRRENCSHAPIISGQENTEVRRHGK